ncbi:replication factor A protein 3 [Geopyxis carbonaria]|nr:replication factor A protein 3 [Geopyxis carbonaria]
MTEHQTPRINASNLQGFLNKTVRIVGKVVDVRGDSATIDAQGTITLTLGQDNQLVLGNGVEVIGKVLPGNNELVVKVLMSWDLGPDVDFNIANAVVEATHRHKALFYDP